VAPDHIAQITQFVEHYGYAVLVAGTFLEGETVLVLGGLAAKLGYLHLPAVMAAGFAGTLLGDQLYFQLGRRHGPWILARRPGWRVSADRAFALVERHPDLIILAFRFLYGLRTVTPFVLGMSRVPAWRYTLLNAAGGLVWAVAVAGAGYLLGNAAEVFLGQLKRYEGAVVAAVALAGAVVWVVHLARTRRRARRG
jgi:membrane protein DedA with SNARE-associated domain